MRAGRTSRAIVWPPWLSPIADGEVLVYLQVADDSRRTRVMGTSAGRLSVQVAAIEQAGRGGSVDRVLVRFLARALRIDTAQVAVVAGARRPRKTLRLAGVGPAQCLLALAPRPAHR